MDRKFWVFLAFLLQSLSHPSLGSNAASGLTRCSFSVGLAAHTLELGALTVSLAAPGANRKRDLDRARLEVKEAYQGVLGDSLSAQILGAPEIQLLLSSPGRRLLATGSQSLVLPTQEAIDTICGHARSLGLTEDRLTALLEEVLQELFPTEQKREAPFTQRHRAFQDFSFLQEDGSLVPNLSLVFPAGRDEVYAAVLRGEVYRLSLSPNPKSKTQIWKKVYPTEKTPPEHLSGRLTPRIAVSPDGESLAVDDGHALSLVSLKTETILWTENETGFTSLRFSPDGSQFVAAHPERSVQVFSTQNGHLETFYFCWDPNHFVEFSKSKVDLIKGFSQAEFSPNGRFILLRGDQYWFSIDWTGNKHIHQLFTLDRQAHLWGYFGGKDLVASNFSGILRHIELDWNATWFMPKDKHYEFYQVIADETRRVAYLTYVGNPVVQPVSVYPQSHGVRLEKPFVAVKENAITAHALSPDGRMMAVMSDKAIYFWDLSKLETPKLLKKFPSVFPVISTSKTFGFSGTGSYFAGLNAQGDFEVLDLTKFKSKTK